MNINEKINEYLSEATDKTPKSAYMGRDKEVSN